LAVKNVWHHKCVEVLCYFDLFSDIRASHIFVQSDGSICLSGLRHCFSMIARGHRLKYVHDFPDFYVNSLNWASRELLEQVGTFHDWLFLRIPS
jgi:hypothetical protein